MARVCVSGHRCQLLELGGCFYVVPGLGRDQRHLLFTGVGGADPIVVFVERRGLVMAREGGSW